MQGALFRRVAWAAAAWGLLAGAIPAKAHNTWLLSSRYSAKQQTTVRLAVVTTEHFPTSEYKTSPERVAEWVVWRGKTKKTIRDYHRKELDLVAEAHLDEPGMYVIAVALHPHFIEFEGGYFEQYLADEHAAEALAARSKTGDGKKPGRMHYTKLIKTFAEIGDRPTEDYKTPVGHTLEIVPLSNPCRWKIGDRVTIRVLYEGQPAANVRVSSGHENMTMHNHRKSQSHDYIENVFTNAAGKATLTLDCPGLWFFRAHVIRPCTNEQKGDGDSPRADWESFWSTTTFLVHGQPDSSHHHEHDHP